MISGKNIYMIGIKGVGMTALSLVYHRSGNVVTGSDVPTHFITDPVLNKYGLSIHEGFDAHHIVDDIDFIVVSGAHSNDQNPEYVAAKEKNIKIQSHAEALGELMDNFALRISVCGSHGKTTTSAMLATIFSKSSLKGAHHIGVPDFSGLDGGMFNGTDYIIVEADEYATNPHVDNTPRFAFQHPNILACTNIDFDHPDVYKDLEAVQKVFGEFMLATLNKSGKVVYCGDDPALSKVVAELPKDNLFSYGTSESDDLVISQIQDNAHETSFQCTLRGEDLGIFHIELPGQHNILNAACAILVSHLSKIEMPLVSDGLAQFTGSKRRFELIGSKNSTFLYDDYAHHPKEIAAVIEAARHKFPDNRILVIFQPHTFSRTNALATEFAAALQTADEHYVLSIFSSEREKEEQLTTPELGKLYNADELLDVLKTKDLHDTTLITMGAGDVYDMHEELQTILAQNS